MIHASEIDRPDVEWLNTDRPLSLSTLKGRLVLLDFWTFCCVNCLHIIPLLSNLEHRFAEKLIVIGVHSPKFAHERNLDQVKQAIKRYAIRHPVIHDPNRRLWDEYAIKAWPTLVLISGDGYVIGQYPGEPQAAALESLIEQSVSQLTVAGETQSFAVSPDPENALFVSPFRYPAKIKLATGNPTSWAMTDTGHHQVVLLNATGAETTRFGAGEQGFVDGPRNTGKLNGPEGLCCSDSTIYVADTRNHAIRYIDLESDRISTLAGTGERGTPLTNYWSNSKQVALASPWDIELVGDRLFFANAGTHQLGELRLIDGSVRLAAGNGREGIHDGSARQAHLAQPSGLAYDAKLQVLYFVDSKTSSVRSFNLRNKWVETLVGEGLFEFGDVDGSFDEAKLQHPLGIALCEGKLYVADTYNNAVKVLDPSRRTVSNLESDQTVCRDPLCLPLAEPAGVACSADQRLLVVDTNNHRIVQYNLRAKETVTWSPTLSDQQTGTG